MPLIFDDQFAGQQPIVKELPKPSEGPSFSETVGAAFRQENDVLNAYDLMTREYDPKPEQGFDLVQSLQTYDSQNRTNFWNNYRENFLGVNNQNEMRLRIGRIERENTDRQTVADGGWTGILSSMAAGTLSPTLLFPFVGQERGAAAIVKGAGSMLAQSALQEGVLQSAQETRTAAESAFNIGAGTFLGGLVGAAVGHMNAKEFAAAEAKLAADVKRLRENGMAHTLGETTISEPFGVGAAGTAAPFAGGMMQGNKVTGAVNEQLARIGPVTDTLRAFEPTEIKLTDGTSVDYRWEGPARIMNQLADAGVERSGNALGRATAEGGTVESRIKMWTGVFADVNRRLDNLYAEHVFDRTDVTVLRNVRASVSGWLSEGKMTRSDWREAIGRALFDENPHPNKFVAAAVEEVRSRFYEQFKTEMKRAGTSDEFFKLVGDAVYANRLWSTAKIRRKQGEFAARLAQKFNEKYNADFVKSLGKFTERQAKSGEALADLQRPAGEAEALIKKLSEERKGMRDALPEDIATLDERIAAARQDLYYARESRKEAAKNGTKQPGHDAAIERIKQQIKDLTEQGGEQLTLSTERRREINRRLTNLNKSRVIMERDQLAKLERIINLEDLAQNSFESAAKKIRNMMDQLDSYSPKEIEKTLNEIGEKILAATERRQRYVDEYLKTSYSFQGVGSTADLNKLQRLSEQADKWKAKAEALAEQFDNIDGADVELVRAVLRTAIDDVVRETTELNAIRAVRQYRLMEQAKKLDPKLVDERVAALKKAETDRRLEFTDQMRQRGADNIDLEGGTADFSEKAKADADKVTSNILGSTVRLAEIDLIQAERDAGLARLLDFPSLDFADFLELDVEKMMRAYVRTMGPDLEMNAKFGTPNAGQQLEDAIAKEGQLIHDKLDALLKDGKLTEAQHKKWADRATADEQRLAENLRAVIQRLRHQRGIPSDPYALDYRMGRVLQDLATARFMGGVLISSIPDIARPVMRYGLLKTFKNGFGLLVSDFKALKLSSREAKLAGTALDVEIHQRANAIADVFDDLGRYSKFERGMSYVANSVGQIGLFDHWTSGMKTITSAVAIGELTSAIEAVVKGGSLQNLADANARLASGGINGRLAQKIWKEITEGGAERRNGVWWPNTEDWKDPEAVRAFRAALVQEIDNTIITPGVERPKWVDRGIGHKLVAQFKSFTLSSTTKTLMSGLQRPDMAFANGVMMSLALGAASYYLWAVATGGEEYQKMLKADLGKWADEAINRSGVLGVFQLAQDAASRTPLRPYVTFSGEQTKRSGGDDLVEFVAGPTMDTIQKAFQVLTGLDEPTQSTLHAGRQLLPFNKVSYLRQLIDKIEAATGDALNLPERR